MQPPGTMISSDRGVFVNGGQFTQFNNYHGQASLGNKAPIDILTEAVSPNALHNSGASFEKPKCHPRTRVKIRDIIMRWTALRRDKDDETGKQFMWLNGAAGCGKSAIAQSTIESCVEHGLPLASFFFNRSDPTRNHAGSLVATLAYQLYFAFPRSKVQKGILSAIKKDPLIFNKTPQHQFTSLIIQPLKTYFSRTWFVKRRTPFLIVIDGLDECTDRTAQKLILTVLAEAVRNSNLLVFVASRPEHGIKLSFSSTYLKDIHTVLSLDLEVKRDADSDLRFYLFDRFAEIKDDFNNHTAGRKLAQDWPGDEVIETLVGNSSRQFIYAVTVIRYVESPRHRPDHRLDVVLNHRPVTGEHPFTQLDALYAMILESALDIEKVLHVLSLYLMDLEENICFSVIEKMLSYDEGEVEILFCDMGALVQVYKSKYNDQLYLRFLHASFREYLLDAARSKQFHINENYENIRHVTHALQYLAASCCSSSFDPDSFAGAPMWILYYTQEWIDLGISQIPILLDVQQAVFSFPLQEFLEPHTSTRTFRRLLECFITPFLEFLEAMVVNDPALSYIQDHQLGILRSVLMQQMQQYSNDDEQAAILVLFYHTGSHRFVPVLPKANDFNCYSYPFLLFRDFHGSDILSLSRIWHDSNRSRGDNAYHHFVRQLLRDTLAGQSPEHALGPIMHARSALACFEELARRVPPPPRSSSGKNIDIAPITDDAEDDTYRKLRFWPVTNNTEDKSYANLVFDSPNGGQWQFKYEEPYARDDMVPLDICFLLLGYLIFLLPRCGRLDALVAACKDYTRLPDNPKSNLQRMYNFFPVRRSLFHKEINKYLARVSPDIMSESRI